MVQRASLGRTLLRIIIAALCVAAAVACYALLGGEFSDTDWKIIGTSTLFALVSAIAAAGSAVHERSRPLAAVTVGSAALSFALLTVALWLEIDGEAFWRVTGCVVIVAVESAHVAFVLSRRRPTDPQATITVTRVAVALAVVSAAMGIAPLARALPDDGNYTLYGGLLGVALVGQLLCTVLAPLLRRLRAGDERPAIEVPPPQQSLASELFAVAERLEQIGAGPQVRAECERLRRLARTAATR